MPEKTTVHTNVQNTKDPGIVFFSGGSALRETASALAKNVFSTHIITTFDSGGSSAAIRKAFDIPAVGDIRSRILALAVPKTPQEKALCDFLSYRLPKEASIEALENEFASLCDGTHPLMENLAAADRARLKNRMLTFRKLAPVGFHFNLASIGNIVLTVGAIEEGSLLPVVERLSKTLRINGCVLPVTEQTAHLAVTLEDGEHIVGQHKFTGKAAQVINSPIKDIWLTKNSFDLQKYHVEPAPHVLDAVERAQCLCYPMGSFFSSVVSNLLVNGVGNAISRAKCPKIFIPNPGEDPELTGMTLRGQISFILNLLNANKKYSVPADFITIMLVDMVHSNYVGGIPFDYLKELGIKVFDADLADERNPLLFNGEKVARVLVELSQIS